MDPAMASELEKHDKLKEKYSKLKESYAVLKKGLLDKQDECGRLELQLKEKETRLRQQLEEIDKLQYQNGRMSKQLGTLNSQVEELKQKTQQSSWSVGGLISGKPQQEAILKAEEEIRVLRDHMEMKIQENEELHMKLFEDLRAHEEECQRLREERVATATELEQKSSDLEKERQQNGRLRGEAKEASQTIQTLEEQLVKAKSSMDSLESTLEGERRDAKRHAASLQAKLARILPFDEAAHEPWSQWNVAPRFGREVLRRGQSVQLLQASVVEACTHGASVLRLWGRTFGQAPGDEPAARAQVRTKLSDAAQGLATLLKEAVPEMVGSLGSAQLRPGPEAARELRRGAGAVVQAHRKWVTYQSLLLMYDWSPSASSSGGRGGPEAHAVVESLWSLHRSVRALAAKLRLVGFVPLLVSRGASASHFGLAREALRRGGSRARDGSEWPRRCREAPERLLAKIAVALGDAASSWEGLGRGLSALASAQAAGQEGSPRDSNSMGELLDSLHRFCSCMADRVMPALDQVVAEVPWTLSMMAQRGCWAGSEVPPLPDAPRSGQAGAGQAAAAGGQGCPGLSCYLHRAAARLRQAPASIGFAESQQTLLLARRLSADASRAKGELRQQVERLQAATEEKSSLADELRSLQDKHELLRSNFQVLQDASPRRTEEEPPRSAAPRPGAAAAAPAAAPAPAPAPAGVGEMVLSSRQRALLESLSVTAQESASLRQHGFFVDVISLSAGEAALASGPPDAEASDSWEAAVRKVYEQHCRSLQSQVRAADGRAVDLQLSVQKCADLRREQEEVKQQLRGEVQAKHAQLDSMKEDMATTRKNYDSQLAMLTEHICTLSVRLSEKDAGLASLQAQKILCGHCGMWNAMGKLMSKEGGGTCKTCKEKVLSEGSA